MTCGRWILSWVVLGALAATALGQEAKEAEGKPSPQADSPEYQPDEFTPEAAETGQDEPSEPENAPPQTPAAASETSGLPAASEKAEITDTGEPRSPEPVDPAIPLPQRLQDAVEQCVMACVSGQATVEEASQALIALYDPILQVGRSSDLPAETETQLRLGDTLDRMALDARIRRIELKLRPPLREKFRAFRSRYPAIFKDVMDSDIDVRVAALERLRTARDPEKLGVPMAGICLYHPSPEIVSKAMEVVNQQEYADPFVMDGLIRIATVYYDWDGYWYDPGSDQEIAVKALGVLYNFKSPHASPKLAELFTQGDSDDMPRLRLIETLGASGDLRLVPYLKKHLSSTHINDTTEGPDFKITSAPCDRALLTLILLSGSRFSSYRVVVLETDWGRALYGFESAKDRRFALKKFEKWYNRHKDGKLKDLPGLETPEAADETQAAIATDQEVPLPEIDALVADLRKACREEITNFQADRYRTRRQAVEDLLHLHRTFTGALTDRGLSAGSQARELCVDVLGRIVAETRLTAVLARARVRNRRQLIEALTGSATRRQGFYSLRWSERAEALRWLGSNRKLLHAAEQILLDGLVDASPIIQAASVEAMTRAKPTSPRLIEAAGTLMIRSLLQEAERDYRFGFYDEDGQEMPIQLIQLFGELDSSNGLPYLLGALNVIDPYNRDELPARLIFKLLGDSGDKNLIPLLLKSLENDNAMMSRGNGEINLEICEADQALRALVRLTGQDEKDYNFLYWPKDEWDTDQDRVRLFGFPNDEARKKAIGKFRKWWNKNKDDKEYEKLVAPTPVRLPDVQEESPENVFSGE